jgi:hypothetical protein
MKILKSLQVRKQDIWAQSPFVKNPTSPAFKVNTETNLWYCFETQQGGNLTDFVKALAKVNITAAKQKINSEWKPIETLEIKYQPDVLLYGLMCDSDGNLIGDDENNDNHINVGYYVPPDICPTPRLDFNYCCNDYRMKPTHWMPLSKPQIQE